MRKLITILFCIISTFSFAQTRLTKDTTFGGWNARISYVNGYTDSTELIINVNGLGEVGTDTTKARVYGPHYYQYNGWNMDVRLADNLYRNSLVFVTLQQPSGYRPPSVSESIIDLIFTRFKPKTNARYGMGLSNGGWFMSSYMYYEPSLHNHTVMSKFTAYVIIEGERNDDNIGADPYSWPNYFGHGAKNSNYKVLYFEQWNDMRGWDAIIKRMIDSVGGTNTRFRYICTNFGSGGHSNFNDMYDPNQTNWTLTNPDVQATNGGVISTIPISTGQNNYQWLLRQGDTTISAVGALLVNAGTDQNIQLPTSTASLTGIVSGGVYPYSYAWTKISGTGSQSITNNTTLTPTITGLVSGTYVFRLTTTDNASTVVTDDVQLTMLPECNVAAPVTYTLGGGSEIYMTNASGQPWKGGDTINILAGTYSVIEIDSFGGDKCRDIVIRNWGGQVNVTGNMRFKHGVHHVTVTGNGDAGITYGFKLGNAFASESSNHFTLRRVEVTNPAGVGLYIKQDPYSAYPNTIYPNYLMNKITIDSCFIHDVDGEGMYIGHTYPNGDPANSYNIPIRLDSVTISNCIVDSTGWDGIQLSNARNGNRIFGNTVTNFGLHGIGGQIAGIIMGGNSNGDIYNNIVKYGKGNGIQYFGFGTGNIYGNFIDSVGYSGRIVGGTVVNDQSIYCNDNVNAVEVNPAQNLNIYNNTIYHRQLCEAVRVANNGGTSSPSTVHNNTFKISSGSVTNWESTRILLSPAGFSVYLNTLITDTPESSNNTIRGLMRVTN